MGLSREEYAEFRRWQRQQARRRTRPSFTVSFLTTLIVVVVLALAVERMMPGMVSVPLSILIARAFPEAPIALNGTPVALPTARVVATPLPSPVPAAPPAPAVVQYVPVVQTVLVEPPAPTPLPAGVSVSVNESGAQLAVSNGAPAPTDVPPPTALPQPGEPGFVDSFKVPTPLPEGNPFIGCLPTRCGRP